MNTLATSKWFYTHGFETWLIIAIIFTLIGLLCGWLLWRHCEANALALEKRNEELTNHYSKLQKNQHEVSSLFNDFS